MAHDHLNVIMTRDSAGANHVELKAPGAPRKRLASCGVDTVDHSTVALYPVGEPRGLALFARLCDACSDALTA